MELSFFDAGKYLGGMLEFLILLSTYSFCPHLFTIPNFVIKCNHFLVLQSSNISIHKKLAAELGFDHAI